MIKNALIIALVVYLIYLYYQKKQQPNLLTFSGTGSENQELVQVQAANQTLTSFLRDQIKL